MKRKRKARRWAQTRKRDFAITLRLHDTLVPVATGRGRWVVVGVTRWDGHVAPEVEPR